MLVAEVCVNVPVQDICKNFTYAVPARLNFLSAGWRVTIPFGSRKIDGFVIGVREISDAAKEFSFLLKEIIDVIDDEAWFTPEMIRAAQWLADFYLCPLSRAMTLFMPGQRGRKISLKSEQIFKLGKNFAEEDFKKTPARLKILRLLREKKELRSSELKELKISRSTIKSLIDAGFVREEKIRISRDSYANVQALQKIITLNAEQFAAVETVKKFLLEKIFQGFLLHGVTGSGKTQVYIELTKIARKIGRRAIILVPEISLTGQIVHNFKGYFSDIAVIHSGLSVAERSEVFHRIRNGEIGVVIGARSALFTPIDDVGLIVVDEEQDHSYKQEKIQPYYQARVVAEQLAKFHGATIVFGSATPSLESYYRAQKGELIYLELPNRIFNQPLPEVEIVDMRAELHAGNKSALSRSLTNLLEDTLENNQQAILLLNRRGYSTFVMCRDCGFVVQCPHCGRPMVYHAEGYLKCHNCEVRHAPPKSCPACESTKIKFFGTGTQKLEEYLKVTLPKAKILRMDRDAVDKKFGHREILEAFGRGEYDILFGTQMVAKGHDIRNVTAVGILNADFILNFADFRAEEQCFALIMQAAGRAGRAKIPGKVVVQTYNTKADAIIFGCLQDYKNFYEHELPKREKTFFPPYSRLVKLLFFAKDAKKAKDLAKKIVADFKSEVLTAAAESVHEINGPISASIEILDGVYRFVVLIHTLDLDAVRNFLRAHELHTMPGVQIDLDPLKTD